ncbi:glycosyl transferase family protein [Pelagerythrobacter sp.]|uniref:glycosyl transferase family protein n=1 Tax=Pelagerythrobacter sp. TaxID=2800702 RepID=UPI0035B4B2EF
MISGGFSPIEWLVLVERELLLFAGVFFLIGALDEFAVDLAWLWLRVTGRARTAVFDARTRNDDPSSGETFAVFVPAWREELVIGATLRHMLHVWPDPALRIYVGCYANDPKTLEAAMAVAGSEDRIRLVVHEAEGPTTKADCLNRLYLALETDEARGGVRAGAVVLHDAEDMVDPAALSLIRASLRGADLVQLPVLPLPQRKSRWVGSHYCEEFAEAHGKGLVVRDALGAGIPLAGVGCGIARGALARLAALRDGNVPFAAECLTEDYELGLGIATMGGHTRFVRRRAPDARLIATRAYFPDRLDHAVRQKTRWVFEIAFQGWDRLGWHRAPVEIWMRLRDRRGPLTALVLAVAYAVLLLAGIGWVAGLAGVTHAAPLSPLLASILLANFASFAWRCVMRFGFTAREYGMAEGLRAVARIPLTNVIAIMAGRRALFGYVRSLRGTTPRWDKTEHAAHPALAMREAIA